MNSNIPDKSLRERLAELEHIQWQHWTKYFLRNLTSENVRRWSRQTETPYGKLSEREKNKDRRWADKVLNLVTNKIKQSTLKLPPT